MKKKLFFSALTAAMVMAAVTGCASGEPAHTHAPQDGWDRNGTEHWQNCACGEKLESAAHTLDDAGVCSVCGSEVLDWGDGTIDVYNYDDAGNYTHQSSFSKGGELLQEYIYEREYDADGNLTLEKVLLDGVLAEEYLYTTDENGTWQSGYVIHYDDGSKTVGGYDVEGNIILTQAYDAAGELEHEARSEFAVSDSGVSYEANCTELYADGTKVYAEYTQYGDHTLREFYAADGTLESSESCEYGYNSEGQRTWVREYENGVLTYEILNYAECSGSDGSWWRYPENTVEYFENGTKMATFYGPDTEAARKTWYNAEGSVVHELTFTTEYTEEGYLNRILTYDGDTLVMESQYAINSDGWTYLAMETEYRPDGTTMVREYDENEELISETEHGKD